MRQLTLKKIGTAVAFMVGGSILGCLVLAWFVQKEWISLDMAGLILKLLTAGILFTVCFLTVRPLSKNKLPVAMLLYGVFLAVCILGKLIFFPNGNWEFGLGDLLGVGAAAMSGIIASMKKERRR